MNKYFTQKYLFVINVIKALLIALIFSNSAFAEVYTYNCTVEVSCMFGMCTLGPQEVVAANLAGAEDGAYAYF